MNTTGLYRRLLGYVLPYRWVFALSIVGMVVVAAAETIFAALLKPIMDGGFIERDSEIIQSTPFLLIGVFAARALGAFADQYSIAWVGRQMVFDLRQALFDRMIRLPVAYYDRHPSAGLISKLIYDLEQVAEASTTSVRVLVKDSLLCTGLILWMLLLSWQLTLIFLLITPFVAIVVGKAGRRFRSSSEGIQASMGGITHVAKEAFQGHKVIKAYAGYKYENRIFQAANQANRRQSLR
ncbi:MAG TPA: ABC transporter transmembrane domain-containing protein, partial [Arenicellales bacterium]|nr:ABC transporter transmembrane domain-containing protein [Arenicellales bacterium]